MTANELDSRVVVVHECFSERGDTLILGAIASEAARQLTSFSG